MRLAIEQAEKVPRIPFGAVIVDRVTGRVVAEGHARPDDNPTFHGEMDAINQCASRHRDIDWQALVLYTTGESCPMCQAAIMWARIGMVVYGTSIPALQEYGFGQIDIRSTEIVEHAYLQQCVVLGGVLEAECTSLFKAASQGPLKKGR